MIGSTRCESTNMKCESTNKTHNGFTLLLASLVGSLLLALGIATFNIILRELNLSSSVRESHIAFYAADSGWECAFYWDTQKKFATSTFSSVPEPTSINCQNVSVGVSSSRNISSATSNFLINLEGGACASVSVYKHDDGLSGDKTSGDKISATTIESRGKNNCSTEAVRDRVERAIRVKY